MKQIPSKVIAAPSGGDDVATFLNTKLKNFVKSVFVSEKKRQPSADHGGVLVLSTSHKFKKKKTLEIFPNASKLPCESRSSSKSKLRLGEEHTFEPQFETPCGVVSELLPLSQFELKLLGKSKPIPKEKVILFTQLSELEIAAITTVIEDIYSIFGIIETSSYFDEQEASRFLIYEPPVKRFYGKPFDLPINFGRKNHYNGDMQARERLECLTIRKILSDTVQELLLKGSYITLQHAILIPHITERDEQQLISELADNLNRLASLKEEIKSCGKTHKDKSQDIRAWSKGRGYCRRLIHYNGVEERYMQKWIGAREFQHTYRLKRDEVELKKSVDVLTTKVKNATYAHENVKMFFKMELKKLLNKIGYFGQKRKDDLEAAEVDLETVRLEIEKTKYSKTMAQETYEKMKKKVDRIRERRMQFIEKERQYQRELNAAKRIQRWWRRMLPRLRQRKQKKGKKGKNKEKKSRK